jgi:hypothetical protein
LRVQAVQRLATRDAGSRRDDANSWLMWFIRSASAPNSSRFGTLIVAAKFPFATSLKKP